MTDTIDQTRRKVLLAGTAALAASALATGPAVAGYEDADLGLFGGINRVKDPKNPSGLEAKHAPVFEAPASAKAGETVSVKVSIGSVPHPMTDAHWIERIRVFTAKGAPVADVTFGRTGVNAEVSVQVTVAEATTLIAQATCNLHGIWESRHEIAV